VAVVDIVFLDTSILLPGLLDMGSGSKSPREILLAIADSKIRHAVTAWHCCLEFYAVSTRLPQELRISPNEAARLIEESILARFHVSGLPASRWKGFFDSAARRDVAGGAIYDAHIAETALRAGAAVVVTENTRHFASLLPQGIRVVTAAEFEVR
jgi:predicted nucleic acid-binding protein